MNKKLFLGSIMLCILLVASYFWSQEQENPTVKTHKTSSGQFSGAWESMQFINNSRAFPEQDIPPAAYTNAFNFYKENFKQKSSRLSSAVSPWYNLGPDDIGGRTLAMAFDPADTNTIWLGSASGGLWKSTTGGLGSNAWVFIPTGFPVLGISSIAIDPLNTNVMYIGTGEMHSYGSSVNGLVERPTRGSVGIGILKSIDGGTTWNPSLDWQYQQVRGIWDLQINPLNPSVVYAATTEGVYKTNDAGANWTRVLNELMVMDILLDPIDTSYVYAGVGNVSSPNPGIYRSTNAGTSWNRINSGLPLPTNTGRITLAMNKQNHNSLIALVADLFSTVGIYSSNNRGTTWSTNTGLTEIVSYQGWYAKGLCMKDDDSSKVLFGGVYLFRSDQHGNFPSILPNTYDVHPDIHDIVSNPLNPSSIYILTDGGLYRSYDFGDTFFPCTNGYITSQSYIGSVAKLDASMILSGLQDNYTIRYLGAQSWLPVIGGDGSFNAIDPTNTDFAYGSSQYMNINKSVDGGFSFNPILNHSASSSGVNNVAFIAPFALSNSNPNVLYAAADSLFRSDDKGDSWTTPQNSLLDGGNVALSIAISWTYSDSLYICTAPANSRPMSVQVSGDGGNTFTNVSAGLPNRYPRDIAIDPRDSRIVYVAFSGFGSGHLFKSTNSGQTWTDISTALPDIPFHCIMHDLMHPDTIYAGSDLGVFVSADAGLNWDAMNLGLPDAVMVFDLAYSYADQTILAFTHGNGVYKNDATGLSVGITPSPAKNQLELKIINNPGSEILRYTLSASNPVDIKIYDMAGKLLFDEISQNSDQGQINISSFKPGCYFIRAESESQSLTRKFVKH
ncbi:MAG: T9SS type A sorting domain-containing protein [Bacteroidetes bacterium]|nr:MAG: T9SS type A sorting domain-containing protein [Bacteroidota bacterium]